MGLPGTRRACHARAMFPSRVRKRLRRQAGVVTRPQLVRDHGCGEGQVEGWLRRGVIEVIRYQGVPLTGTYRVPGGGIPPEQHLVAAALRCRPEAWIAGPAALGLLGFEGYKATDPFVVLVPPGRVVANVPFPVVQDTMPGQHRARCGPVPIAAPTRSVVEATRTISGKRLRTTVDYGKWKRLLDLRALRACAVATGLPQAAELIAMIDDGVFDQDSEGERALAPILGDLRPAPLWQYWVSDNRRVDCLLADVPLVLEYLGDVAHGRPHQRARDHGRNRELEALGYVVLEVTVADVAQAEILRATVLGIRAGLLAAGARHPHLPRRTA